MASILSAGTTNSTALNLTADTSGSLILASNNNVTAVTIATNQNVTFANNATFPTTIGVGGATPSASGSGISFPATQSASSDANTLDDYEEGTWTPNFQNNGSTSNWTTKSGRYVKIGQQVTIWFTNGGGGSSNGGSGSGAIILNGLPFPLSYGNSFNGQQAISIIGGSNTNQPGLDWLTSQGGTGTGAQVAYNAAGNQEQNALTYVSGVWTYLTA